MPWVSVGYGEPERSAAANVRGALEERRAFLRAELERTESLLQGAQEPEGSSGEGSGK